MDETLDNISKSAVKEAFREWFNSDNVEPATTEVYKSEEFLEDCTEYFWDRLSQKG